VGLFIYNLKCPGKNNRNLKCVPGYPGVRSTTEAEDFSSNLCVQTGSGAHPASCTRSSGGSFPGGKARPGRDADHSPPSSVEIKKEQELYLLSPKCASMERNGTTLRLPGYPEQACPPKWPEV
jgi:hypothetical protein